jgi:hypothetical protein
LGSGEGGGEVASGGGRGCKRAGGEPNFNAPVWLS